MPLFEYKCRSCKKDFEILHLPEREAKLLCPHCDSKEIIQKISLFAAHGTKSSAEGGPDPSESGDMCARCGEEPRTCAAGNEEDE